MRAHVAEFLGTFTLVFFGCGAIADGLPPIGIAAAFGLAISVGIYAFGHISGAHFNPAVSVGFAIGRHLPWARAATYALAQIAGAVAAAGLLRVTLGGSIGVSHPAVGTAPALTWEIVMTSVLMVVITAVATDARAVGEAAALAIGGSVALASLVGGSVSGSSLNPARALGPALVGGDLADLWIYIAGPLVGATIGALLYRYLRGSDGGERRPEAGEADD